MNIEDIKKEFEEKFLSGNIKQMNEDGFTHPMWKWIEQKLTQQREKIVESVLEDLHEKGYFQKDNEIYHHAKYVAKDYLSQQREKDV